MKTIGLLGGMSWESTVDYYRLVNEGVKARLGGLHSARCILSSVEFAEIEACQSAGDWEKAGQILGDAAVGLEKAGAEFFLICTNTMHKVADAVQARVGIPLIHIAQVTADALEAAGIQKVGLLGTRYTMEQDFYRKQLEERGIQVLVPQEPARGEINRVIFEELCLGKVLENSRRTFLQEAAQLQEAGAQGVILGCTEIGMLLKQSDTPVPLFDTTLLHAERAVKLCLEEYPLG